APAALALESVMVGQHMAREEDGTGRYDADRKLPNAAVCSLLKEAGYDHKLVDGDLFRFSESAALWSESYSPRSHGGFDGGNDVSGAKGVPLAGSVIRASSPGVTTWSGYWYPTAAAQAAAPASAAAAALPPQAAQYNVGEFHEESHRTGSTNIVLTGALG